MLDLEYIICVLCYDGVYRVGFVMYIFGVFGVCVFAYFGCFVFVLVVGGMNVVLCEGVRYYVYNFI